MDLENNPIYKNLISHIGIDRSINTIEHINFRDLNSEPKFKEFLMDINNNNDTIELSIIKNKTYKEAVILSLTTSLRENELLKKFIREEQKTFGGSKLFYLNDELNKILVVSVSRNIEGKLNMTINRLNKINNKITRTNLNIKKENTEIYMERQHTKDKKDLIVDMINKNLKI